MSRYRLQRGSPLSGQRGDAANRAAVSKGIETRRTTMAYERRFRTVADLFFQGEGFRSNQARSVRAGAALDRSGGALRGGGSAARLSRVQNRAWPLNLRRPNRACAPINETPQDRARNSGKIF